WSQSGTTGRDVVLLLDVSRSMFARDVLPNRLGRAKEAAVDLVANSIRKHGGHRIALVLFAARAKVICPLAHDYDHVVEALEAGSPHQPPQDLLPERAGESGTRIGAGLLAALEAHDARFSGHQDIVLLSDGDDPGLDSASERRAGIQRVREAHISVHTIGL